jgi:Cu-Zn family superoxide dismutase
MLKIMALSTCALALALSACSKPANDTAAPTAAAPTTPAATPAPAADGAGATALVALAPTKDSKVSGTLTLTAEQGGVSIVGMVGNLEPGSKHGFHVHDKGDCSAPDGSSAGGHFNPTSMEHGDPTKAGAMHHLGDMMNIEADASGTAQVKVTIPNATLHDGGPNDLIGKGVIVHAAPDDYTTQPSGNSGARLACGRIG